MGTRLRASAVLLGMASAAGGCGGEDPPTVTRDISGPPQQVARVVDRLDGAVRDRDFTLICRELLTPAARERAGGARCAATMAASAEGVRRPQIELLSIRIVGDRAEAKLRTTASGQKPIEETLELARARRGYRITALDR
jgi:hypothetical protein